MKMYLAIMSVVLAVSVTHSGYAQDNNQALNACLDALPQEVHDACYKAIPRDVHDACEQGLSKKEREVCLIDVMLPCLKKAGSCRSVTCTGDKCVAAKLDRGEDCQRADQCASGNCNYGKCSDVALIARGEVCPDDESCASNKCSPATGPNTVEGEVNDARFVSFCE